MRALCKRCAYITHMQTENLKKNSMHQLSISQKRIKKIDSLLQEEEEKKLRDGKSVGLASRIRVLFIVSVRFFPKNENAFVVSTFVDFRIGSQIHAASASVREKKTAKQKQHWSKKMEIVENSIFDFWKNCRNTNRGTDKGKWREKNRSGSAYRKVKSLRAWFVCHSAMISIMIEHSNFRKISFYLYSMAEFLTFALFLSLEESRHLFSHIRFCNGSFSRWCSFTAVSHYFPSIFALSVSHKLLSLSCRCVFFPAGFLVEGNRAKCSSLILIYCYLDAETF